MEPFGIVYVVMFGVMLLMAINLGKRIYINKNEKPLDRHHFSISVVMVIILPLLFTIIPLTNNITPINKDSKIITTKEVIIRQFIIIGSDTLIYKQNSNTDTLSTEVLPDSLKSLNLMTKYTVYGAVWNKKIQE